ncbi:glycoside hydrolase family 13 protein [Allorhizocola rhizosphaerae]|uniref:glycoside hydrolase family 13 protein n=1 Tax=Allorhizocola rhizosphaerae TaxID=1872709 RepID=UPI001FEB501E|nr:alpha-amylase family glycosyl hydrolase [Allorhizocola rhizosphaerae]
MTNEVANDWWRDAVVYQVYPRSFADGNGDGTGDLIGVYDKLEYLSALGVDAIWLSPFYTSPLADGGYDVADYCDVDPRFGTLADFDLLIGRAHELNIRVIVDIVPNHSSSEHPWFREALAGIGRDRYIFRDQPNDWESIFGGPAWTQVPDGQWYLHLFDPSQPDFNWSHPDVHAFFKDVLRFWLQRGVDGFRIDVAHGMIKADGLPDVGALGHRQIELMTTAELPYFDQDGVHEIYREWRPILDEYGAMAVAEAWVSSPARLARYIGRDELHQAFNFDFMVAEFDAKSFRVVIEKSLAEAELVGAPTTWVLSNHDKPRHVTRYGGLARARAATLLMLSLPGSAYLYNGEELGLDEVTDLPPELREDPAFLRTGESRDGCRVPIPWAEGAWTNPWLPMPARWDAITADKQEHDPGSTLNFYRQAIRLRRGFRGDIQWLDVADGVLSFRRGDRRVVLNTSQSPVPIEGTVLMASGPVTDTLPPDTAVWLADR